MDASVPVGNIAVDAATHISKAPPADRIPAAQYIRMSTEHQQYSTLNQSDAIQEYAVRRGYNIVQTYADEGKSGLSLHGRDALKRLIQDVQGGNVAFKTILVYDISRWGRFQDSDESAFYEYTCRRAGISIEYCAEQFENDGSTASTIIKTVKRAMAGEYSRELSNKVFKGQCRLIQLGFRQGGPAGFGLRRMLLDQSGQSKGILKPGEHKSLQTDRVILVPGPPEELNAVRSIYEWFTRDGLKELQIAERMNARDDVQSESGRPWTASMVQQILTNEKYIGNNVFNRISFKLKKKRVRNAPDMWVRANGAFQSVIDPELFFTARGIILERARRFTDEELLDRLRQLLAAHGTLSGPLNDSTDGLPSSSVFQHRFGSLLIAYGRIGYRPDRDFRYLEINRNLKAMQMPFVANLVRDISLAGATITQDLTTGHLTINGEYSALIVLTRCRQSPSGALKWLIDFGRQPPPDITVVVRMDVANQNPVDFFLLPRIGMLGASLCLREFNSIDIETYRFDSLAYFCGMAARSDIEDPG